MHPRLSYEKVWVNNCTPFFLFKKHLCPKCGTRLERTSDSVVVNKYSPEAKDPKWYSLSHGAIHPHMKNTVECVWAVFECPECGAEYTVDDLLEVEGKENKVVMILTFAVFFVIAFLFFALLTKGFS